MTQGLVKHGALAGCGLLALAAMTASASAAQNDYIATIHVIPGSEGAAAETVSGVVFEDLSRDGVRQDDEPGIAGVMVSNSREVVLTDENGAYELPAFDNMTVFVTEPRAYDVPVNDDLVPQFFYHHKPDGTPIELRYGGLPPTGPLPAAINFPMVRGDTSDQFSCVVMGDTQPYSNTEIGYVRDSIVHDLVSQDLSDAQCMILVGDVMGDDLDLLPRFMDMMSTVGLRQYYVHGNHDFDFDATSDADSADSWRRLYGPAYYSYDIGQVHFVVLDNVVYPCGPEDDGPGGRDACADPERTVYNGRVADQQMEWLANNLAHVPEDRLIVLAHHIPFVSFIDSNTGRHQTDNVNDIYELLRGRPALSLSGHTHTLEQLLAGESYQGWQEQVGVGRLPFNHVVTGAPSGNWWSGDLNFDGIPMSFARLGTPRGYLIFDFDGNTYRDTFYGANLPTDRQMAVSFNTPQFRDWFETLYAWTEENDPPHEGIPPLNINDLADTRLMTPEDLGNGVYLVANVWNGSRESDVFAQINDGPRLDMVRTQDGDGEDIRQGAEYADPFATQRQMHVARYAMESASGEPRNQGFELWQGSQFGPVPPQSLEPWMLADQSMHLWRAELPANLPVGTHVATVTTVDRFGREFTDHIVFEVREERPAPRWRNELWETASN